MKHKPPIINGRVFKLICEACGRETTSYTVRRMFGESHHEVIAWPCHGPRHHTPCAGPIFRVEFQEAA